MKLQGKKLLIVEDDNFISDMFIKKLMAEGAVCTRAVNGSEGLDKLKLADFKFDLILTDIMMVNMDGYEMVKKLNDSDHAKEIPIIVLTNRTSLTPENSKITSLKIAGFFIKSNTDLSFLVDEIARVIANNEAGRPITPTISSLR